MTLTPRHGLMVCVASAALVIYACSSMAQEAGATAGAQAVAIAERLLASTREQFVGEGWTAISDPWPELWRP